MVLQSVLILSALHACGLNEAEPEVDAAPSLEARLAPGPRADDPRLPPWLQDLPLEEGPGAPGLGPDAPPLLGGPIWAGNRVYGLQMHVHGTISEGTGTPSWHLDQADAQGLNVIWWTDHDTMYHPDHMFEVTGDDFESGATSFELETWPSGEIAVIRWVEDDVAAGSASLDASADAAYTGDFGGRLELASSGVGTTDHAFWYLKSNPRINFAALLSQVDLEFAWRPSSVSGAAEFRLVVPLSATTLSEDDHRLDDDDYRVVFYWNSEGTTYTDLDDGVSIYVELEDPGDGWGYVSEDLSTLVYAALGETAWELHAELVTLGAVVADGSEAAFEVDDISWTSSLVGDELRQAQVEFLDELDTTLVQHVGTEVSPVSGRHFNAFGKRVPFAPYATDDDITGNDVADLVHFNNGMMSWNHMFGVRQILEDDDTRVALVEAAIEELVDNDAYGCDLLEVGYRQRHGDTQDFLTVWDAAAQAGIVLTGIGTSDLHDRNDWDGWYNRYITWVPARNAGEGRLIMSLMAGHAWFGDPTRFPDGRAVVQLQVPELDMVMGQGAVGLTGTYTAVFTAEWLDEGWVVNFVENGVVVESATVASAGLFRSAQVFDPEGGLTLRVEVWDPDGEGVVFTNPLYFRDTDDGGIPSWRLLED